MDVEVVKPQNHITIVGESKNKGLDGDTKSQYTIKLYFEGGIQEAHDILEQHLQRKKQTVAQPFVNNNPKGFGAI